MHISHKKILQHFGRRMHFLTNNITPPSFENRSIFVEFCIDNCLMVGNTFFFQKIPQKQIIFREAGVIHGLPQASDRYTQLDIFLIPERCFDSDYYIILANVAIDRKKPLLPGPRRPKYLTPTAADWTAYNSTIKKKMCSERQFPE